MRWINAGLAALLVGALALIWLTIPHESAMHWRTHPKLKGRFLPEHPDDLQVIVHDGGPRITDRSPEAVWVTVTGCDRDVFIGRVLNQPTQLRTVQQGQQIRFVMPA